MKRQHSAEPLNALSASPAHSPTSGTPVSSVPDAVSGEPANKAISAVASDLSTAGTVGSPFKKQRASVGGFDDVRKSLGAELLGVGKQEKSNSVGSLPSTSFNMDEDDEL